MSGQLVELKNTVKIKQTTISELKECLRKKDSENEHLKSNIVDFTTVQNLRAQVTKLKSENEDLTLLVEKLTKAHEIVETTLRERDEMVFAQSEKIRLLEEQYEKYFALKETESLKFEIKTLQTENKVLKSRESELNNLEKVYETKKSVLLKDIDQMKS
ncbi:hypothetical protein Tco_0112170 [Tanacetum coccineum]